MQHPTRFPLGIALTALGAALAMQPSIVHACGGCFAPTDSVQVVTDHRMVMSIGPADATLWDQIRFTGNPQDFAWVLPVSGDVDVDVASAEFFDELDAVTAPIVRGPILSTSCGNGGISRFAGAAPSAMGEDSASGGVTVLHTAVVGPYEAVTLRSTDAMSLTMWLQEHHYAIPDSLTTTIRFYVDRHMDFVALRLAPGEGVATMQPIRIHYRGPNATLPLRMVSAGVSDKVGITLWVFAPSRYEAMNFGNATIDASQLAWNWDTNGSNYRDVFADTVAAHDGGRVWITEASDGVDTLRSVLGVGAELSAHDWNLATGASSTHLTRLRADLAARFLDSDLVLAASTDARVVRHIFQPTREIGARPVPSCPSQTVLGGSSGTGVACAVVRPGSTNVPSYPWRTVTFATALTASVIAARRRRTRHRA